MPKQSETAELIVNGRIFKDWESVQVRHCLREQPQLRFRFTCSEALPISKNWGVAMQIRPGYECTIKLAGHLAFTGYVVTRQVYVDAQRHHIELQGCTYAHTNMQASAKVDGMQLKDKTPKQIAEALLKPAGVKMRVVGGKLPEMKFPRFSIHPGESIFESLNRLFLPIGANMGSDPDGNLVVGMGPTDESDSVVEGKNMLDGRELIQNEAFAGQHEVYSQKPSTDKEYGPKSSHEPHVEEKVNKSFLGDHYLPKIVIPNMPGWEIDHLKGRADTERNWQVEDAITVICTVQGWQRPSGGLWQSLQQVHVKSPALIMDMDLTLKAATFTQDNNRGSVTVLELMNRRALDVMLPEPGGGGQQ